MKSTRHSWTGTSLKRLLSVFLALVLLLSTGLSSIAAAMEVEVPDETALEERIAAEEPEIELPEIPAEEPAAEIPEAPAEEPAEVKPVDSEESEAAETDYAEEPEMELPEIPAEEPAEVPAEEPAEEPAETPAEAPEEEPAEEPAEVSEETSEETPDESSEEEPETTVNMPPMSFFDKVGSVSVSVWADKDIFPEGTTMEVKAVDAKNVIDAVQDAMKDDSIETKDITAVDITFKYNGEEIQPADSKAVRVLISTPDKRIDPSTETRSVVHIDSDGEGSLVEVNADDGCEAPTFLVDVERETGEVADGGVVGLYMAAIVAVVVVGSHTYGT